MAKIMKVHPWSVLRDMQHELEHIFDRGGPRDVSNVATSQWSPRVDIKEEKDKYVITADLPGVDPKAIEVSMENNVLSIKGERHLERKSEEENFTRMERFSGTFYRRFSLPEVADAEKIEAVGKHGVLEIIVPKRSIPTQKRIEVKV